MLTALANIGLGVVADAAEIQKQSRTTQHRRILVRGDHHTILGVVHVRDTLRADAGSKAAT